MSKVQQALAKGPFRRVVGRTAVPASGGATRYRETLECGHRLTTKAQFHGRTPPQRRRCGYCVLATMEAP